MYASDFERKSCWKHGRNSLRITKIHPYLRFMDAKQRHWLKKLGWAGFLFFLIKGLVWLGVFFGLGRYFFN